MRVHGKVEMEIVFEQDNKQTVMLQFGVTLNWIGSRSDIKHSFFLLQENGKLSKIANLTSSSL